MSFAALCWALAAFMQSCMLSQYGQKQLQYAWLNKTWEKRLFVLTLIFLVCSFVLNYCYEGSSVGPLSWFFVILPVAFFLHVLSFYLLRSYFVIIWCGAILAGLIFTLFSD